MKSNYFFLAFLGLQLLLASCETGPLVSPKIDPLVIQTSTFEDSSKVTAPGLFAVTLQQVGGPQLRDTIRVKFRNLQTEPVDYMIQLRVVYAEPVEGLYSQVLGVVSTGCLQFNENTKLAFTSRGLPLNKTSAYRAEVFTRGIYFGDFAVEKQ